MSLSSHLSLLSFPHQATTLLLPCTQTQPSACYPSSAILPAAFLSPPAEPTDRLLHKLAALGPLIKAAGSLFKNSRFTC